MSFYPQPNDFTCGPFALKHALVAIGQLANAEDIAAIARTHWWSGTNEIGLAKAARAYDCDLEHERTLNADRARRLLVERLRSRLPVLLCVDDWGHWITALRREGEHFVIVDSDRDPVLDALTWKELERRWRYLDTDYDEDDPPRVYDFLALQPRSRVRVKADFSVRRVRHLRRPENRQLALHWDEYLEDLLEICRPRAATMTGAQTMGELLRRNQDLILSRVTYWHGDVSRARVARVLADLRFVAETYGLVVPASLVRQAVTDLVVLTTMTAVALGGLGSIYGIGE